MNFSNNDKIRFEKGVTHKIVIFERIQQHSHKHGFICTSKFYIPYSKGVIDLGKNHLMVEGFSRLRIIRK